MQANGRIDRKGEKKDDLAKRKRYQTARPPSARTCPTLVAHAVARLYRIDHVDKRKSQFTVIGAKLGSARRSQAQAEDQTTRCSSRAAGIALPAPARALTSVRECRDTQQEPDMTQRLTGSWLVDWSLVTIMGNTMPPRDPEDDDDDEDDDDEVAPDLGAAAQRLAVQPSWPARSALSAAQPPRRSLPHPQRRSCSGYGRRLPRCGISIQLTSQIGQSLQGRAVPNDGPRPVSKPGPQFRKTDVCESRDIFRLTLHCRTRRVLSS